MEKEEQKWGQAEVETQEQEEDASTLVVRKSRNGVENKITEIFAAIDNGDDDDGVSDDGDSEINGQAENGAKNENSLINPEIEHKKIEGIEEAIDGEQKKENLVFFDKDEGVDSTSRPEELDISSPPLDFNIPNNSTTEINNKYEDYLENNNNFSSSIEESSEIDLIDDDDPELKDLDVERVIRKQKTHDLFCPHCNSCITTRVVLKKRKRRIPISDEEEVEWDKIENVVGSVLGEGSVKSHGDRIHGTDSVDDVQISPVDDEGERERGPDIFRCLSCFSFFIPTVKLFRSSGDKSGKEKITNERALPTPSAKKNWFATMFASNNPETVVEQDSTTEQLDLYTKDQPKESKFSKEVHITRENKLSVTTISANGETAEDAFSFSQLGGLLISSNYVSNSEEGQTTKHTVQSRAADHVDPTEPSQHIFKETEYEVHSSESLEVHNISVLKGEHTVININSQRDELSQNLQDSLSETASLLQSSDQGNIAGREITGERREYKIEVIKSIVYGGLAELITSLSVVSSAAGGGAGTLNILALGMANLIGGLFIICHNLWELKCDNRVEQVTNQISDQAPEQRDRYKELLGRRQNFVLHAVVSVISYVVFGSVPPVVYGFSFRKTDDKQLKLVVAAAASLLCIFVLAMGRAHVRRPPKFYLKSVCTFVVLGFMVSGVSYIAGELVERILEKLGLFETSSVTNLLVEELTRPMGSTWASY